jgi:acetyltransferase-like isoleucine patch superfamily enzyme
MKNMDLNELKSFGEDVRVSDLSHITKPKLVEMGSHIAIDMWTYISTQLVMGDYIHIAPSVSIIGGGIALLVMEDFTNIGSGSRIVCASDDFTQGLISPVVPIEHRTVINKPIIFKRFATLGVNCTVLPGVTLGEGCIVGANSVVTRDCEPWMVYAGSPAKPIKPREKSRIMESIKKLGK